MNDSGYYHGGLTAELFVTLLRRMMRRRSKPVHLVVDGLPAHKTALVKAYVASTKGMLTLHFLPGYAPELNPDELVWSHMKRTGVARAPLRRGEKLQEKIEAQLGAIKRMPRLIRSFLKVGKCLLYYRRLNNLSKYTSLRSAIEHGANGQTGEARPLPLPYSSYPLNGRERLVTTKST